MSPRQEQIDMANQVRELLRKGHGRERFIGQLHTFQRWIAREKASQKDRGNLSRQLIEGKALELEPWVRLLSIPKYPTDGLDEHITNLTEAMYGPEPMKPLDESHSACLEFVRLSILHDEALKRDGALQPLTANILDSKCVDSVWQGMRYNWPGWRVCLKECIKDVAATLTEAGGGKDDLARVPISELIKQGEGTSLEFKEALEYDTKKEEKNKDVLLSSLKTIAAFLNSKTGGTLLIGVDNSGKIRGIEQDLSLMKSGNTDKFEQKIRNCLKDRFEPQPISKVNISFEKFTEGTICRVDVQTTKEIVHLDNEVYVRDGNVTQKLEGRALTDWIQQRRN